LTPGTTEEEEIFFDRLAVHSSDPEASNSSAERSKLEEATKIFGECFLYAVLLY
jgi:hypothetical protein